jgi:gluconolactonase
MDREVTPDQEPAAARYSADSARFPGARVGAAAGECGSRAGPPRSYAPPFAFTMLDSHPLAFAALAGLLLVPAPAQIPGIGPTGPVVRAFQGFNFTEGPAQSASGDLYFTDVNTNIIHRVDTANALSPFLTGSQAANGLDFDRTDRMLACLMTAGSVVSIDRSTRALTTLAGLYNGVRFNSPNDLITDAHGGVWFTDPNFRGNFQDREGVYYIDARNVVTRVIANLTRPNGILLSVGDSTLYVASGTPSAVMAYPVLGPGLLGAGRQFFALGGSSVDGMTIDSNGNLYLTRPGFSAIEVVNPAGVSLGRIAIPEAPANVAFGGPAHRTLYVTARTSLYRADMLSTGHVPLRLTASATSVPVGGGSVDLDVLGIPSLQGRTVLLLGSSTGTEPGFLLETARVPLQVDAFTNFALTLVNTPVFSGFLATLDAQGRARARLTLPALDASLVGFEMRFAAVRALPFDAASNAVSVRIAP